MAERCPHYRRIPYHHDSFTGRPATICEKRRHRDSGVCLSCNWYYDDHRGCPVWRANLERIRRKAHGCCVG